MNFVYILHSKILDQYYIGETEDLENRIKQHNNGFYEQAYTKITSDWKLFHSIACNDKSQAIKIERHIKKMKSRKYLENLLKYPEMQTKLKERY